MTPRRWLLLVLAGAACLYLVCLRAYYVGFFNDDAFYIIGARALLHGRYAELNAPGAPPLVNYMPGYSLLLAPIAVIAGGALWPYQLLSVALLVAALFLVWTYFDEAPLAARLSAVVAAAFCPLCVSMAGTVLSDVPLLAIFAAAFVLARRVWQRRQTAPWLGLAALCGFGALVRPTGIALVAALAASLCLERRFKLAALCAAVGLAIPGAFLLRNYLLTGKSLMYLVEAADPLARGALGRTFLANAVFYPKFLFVTTLFRWPRGGGVLDSVTIGVCVLCAVYAVREEEAWEWRKFVQLTLAIFLGVHFLWSKRAGRYLLPAAPFAAGYVMWGLALVAKEYGGGEGACWGAAALSVALSAAPATRIARASLKREGEAARPASETFDWLRAHAAPDDILATELDGRVFLYTGRPTARLHPEPSAQALARRLTDVHARYVVLLANADIMRTASGGTPFDPVRLEEVSLWLSRSPQWRLAFRSRGEGTEIFERSPAT